MLKELQEQLVPLVNKDQLDLKVLGVNKDQLVLKVNKDQLDLLDQQEQQEQQVLMVSQYLLKEVLIL